MRRTASRLVMTLMTALCLSLPGTGFSAGLAETPSALAMTGDALFARPVLLATTVVGSAIFVVSLPFSALGGNVSEAADTLVVGPYKATFVRCLGCTRLGRKEDVVTAQTDQ